MHNHHPVTRRVRACGIALLLTLTTTIVNAGGFALIEQSVSTMGTAHAGAGSIALDATTIWFNPAGMSRLEGRQLAVGTHIVAPSNEFSGTGTYNSANPLIAGSPLAGTSFGGGDGGDGGEAGVIPHFSYVQDINDRMKFGLGVNVPFGLETDYDDGWAGRYSSTEASIFTVNINPSISFRIDEHASIGFGLSAMYAELDYRNDVDFALLDMFGFLDPMGMGASILPGMPAPGTSDANSKVVVDDWGFGFNFGGLLEPTPYTRLGLAYRSKVDLELEGDLTISHPVAPLKEGAGVDVSLPNTLTLSLYHELNPEWAIMADVIWTQWSTVDALTIDRDSGSQTIIPLEWEDTMRYAVGAAYKHSDRWTLRTGVALDETPIPNAELRPTALPGEDRLWLTFGAGYKHSKQLTFDIAYAHLFVDDPKINSTDSHTPPLGTGFHRITGEYDASVDIISAQVNWNF